ncbi:DUF6950 family protein [Paracoccus alkenifer]|uniref:DUF6950 domain-containing protein n=1 Tax=Paracoccus alkenifer TaxID=65735 RepID=A0A1H6NGQ5_9RHOB|nr:hypothetical protein [Paracoccus alkenifer]SEI10161.1 hypothetical protein SAMN04488075_2875 [Paracoccus alkenifer]
MVQRLTRLPNWRARFAAEMDRQRREAFAWGRHDCALGLVTGAIEAITGVDLARGYRGKYRGQAAALRILRDAGCETPGDFAATILPEIPPAMARIGDVGVMSADGPLAQAFCVVDASSLIVMTDLGHGRRPRADMIRAFRVGE